MCDLRDADFFCEMVYNPRGNKVVWVAEICQHKYGSSLYAKGFKVCFCGVVFYVFIFFGGRRTDDSCRYFFDD